MPDGCGKQENLARAPYFPIWRLSVRKHNNIRYSADKIPVSQTVQYKIRYLHCQKEKEEEGMEGVKRRREGGGGYSPNSSNLISKGLTQNIMK